MLQDEDQSLSPVLFTPAPSKIKKQQGLTTVNVQCHNF